MPAARKSDNRRLEVALAAFGQALDETGAPWMVIGGIAVIAHGVRRMTTDIDVVVRGDAIATDELIRRLAASEIVPRIPDALAFAGDNLVLLLRHTPSGVDLDLSFGWTQFEHSALEDRVSAVFGRVEQPMATPQALVTFKVLAARPTDIDDATALLVLHPDIDLARVRREASALAELTEDPRLIHAALAIAVERAALPRSRKPRPRSAPRRRGSTTTRKRPR